MYEIESMGGGLYLKDLEDLRLRRVIVLGSAGYTIEVRYPCFLKKSFLMIESVKMPRVPYGYLSTSTEH